MKKKNKKKIILIGTQKIAYYQFKKIIKKKIYKIILIITKKNDIVCKLSKYKNLNIFKIKNNEEIKNIFKKNIKIKKLYLIIIICFGLKISKYIIKKTKIGCFNIHPSLLPKLKGPSPIQYSILKNYKITGVTLIKINKKIDEGNIILQKKYKINKKENYISLYKKLTKLSLKILFKFFKKIKENKIKYKKQNKKKSTYTKKIYKIDGKINWNNKAKYIERQIRAFCLWPKTFFYYKKYIIFIWKVKIIKKKYIYKIGQIIKYNKKYLDIQTSKNILRITKIQISGKKINKIKNIYNSKPNLFKKNYIIK